jgi:hypothetical protein
VGRLAPLRRERPHSRLRSPAAGILMAPFVAIDRNPVRVSRAQRSMDAAQATPSQVAKSWPRCGHDAMQTRDLSPDALRVSSDLQYPANSGRRCRPAQSPGRCGAHIDGKRLTMPAAASSISTCREKAAMSFKFSS